MMLTIPFVIFGMFRYLFLAHTQNAGGSPEEVFLRIARSSRPSLSGS